MVRQNGQSRRPRRRQIPEILLSRPRRKRRKPRPKPRMATNLPTSLDHSCEARASGIRIQAGARVAGRRGEGGQEHTSASEHDTRARSCSAVQPVHRQAPLKFLPARQRPGERLSLINDQIVCNFILLGLTNAGDPTLHSITQSQTIASMTLPGLPSFVAPVHSLPTLHLHPH